MRDDSAVVIMAWDHGGKRLVGLMLVSRSDCHICFVELPPELEDRLAILDRGYVENHSAELLSIAYKQLAECDFDAERVVSTDFLRQGETPAAPGTMRHIPAERVAGNPRGVATWQQAGFLVDVGEINLEGLAPRTFH